MTRLNAERALILAGRLCLGLFLSLTGVQHFMFTAFVASLFPEWFPGDAVAWTHFAGVALIAGGIGLFIPQTVRLAALVSGLMVFSWFWIVHVPRTFHAVSDSIAVFEALAVSGLAFVLAGAAWRGHRLRQATVRAAVVVAVACTLAGCRAPFRLAPANRCSSCPSKRQNSRPSIRRDRPAHASLQRMPPSEAEPRWSQAEPR